MHRQTTKPTAPGNAKLIEAARQKVLADRRMEKEWTKFWVREAKPLTEERFWQLFPIFKEEVEQFVFGYRRSNGMEQAGHEVARKTVTGESERCTPPYTYEDAIGFALSYRQMSAQVGKALHDLVEEFSDDGWSDFCDAIPLAGEEFCKKALASKGGKKRDGFLDEDEVIEGIKAACTAWVDAHEKDGETQEKRQARIDKWFKLIRFGENYVHTALEDGVKEFYLSLVREHNLTEQEQEELY